MKWVILVLGLAGWASASISAVSLPHTIDSAAVPKVQYIDDNDVELKDKVNEVVDTLNAYVGGGLSSTVLQSTSGVRVTVDSDANGTTEKFAVTRNGSTDTIAAGYESDLSWKVFGPFSATTGAFSGDVTLSGSDGLIKSSTSDGSDSKRLQFAGGGAADATRGAYINLRGNEYATDGGFLNLLSGNASGAAITFSTGSASERMRVSSGGNLLVGTTTDDGTNKVQVAGTGKFRNAQIENTAGSVRGLQYASSNVLRWNIYADADAESGSDAGSTLKIGRYNDAGALQDVPLSIRRSDGLTTLAKTVNLSGLTASTALALDSSKNVVSKTVLNSSGSFAAYADTGAFTGTLTGVSGTVTATLRWTKIGDVATLYIPSILGTSNSTDCTITGMPAAITPINTHEQIAWVYDNGAHVTGAIGVSSFGVITLEKNPSGFGNDFTASGSKGLGLAQAITYILR